MSPGTWGMRLGAAVVLAAVAGGCNLILGITDLSHRGSGGGGGGGTGGTGTTSSSTGGSSTGGNTGSGGADAGPCATNADCKQGGTVCLAGSCVTPVCTEDPTTFDVLAPSDINGDSLYNGDLIAVSAGNDAYIAARDATSPALVVRHLSNGGGLGGTSTYACNMYCDFTSARGSTTQVAFQGVAAGTVGEVVFTRAADGSLNNPTWSPFPTPAPCAAQNAAAKALFAQVGNATKYAAVCDDGTGGRTLWTGGSDEPTPTQIGSGMTADYALKMVAFAATTGQRLLLLGQEDMGVALWRGGAQPADLAGTGKPLQLNTDPKFTTSMGGIAAVLTNDGFVFTGGYYTMLPLSATFMSGAIKDVSALAMVPPPGLSPTPVASSDVVSRFGKNGNLLVNSAGAYQAVATIDNLHIALHWLTPTGQVLLLGHPVFTEPDAGASTFVAAAVTMLETKVLVAWLEQSGSTLSVHARASFCVAQ